MIKVWISFVVVIMCMILCSTVYGEVPGSLEWETALLTNIKTDRMEGRAGYRMDGWAMGALATWYTNEDTGAEWSLGAYAKLFVDPNATLPVSDLVPVMGDWLDLPDSIQANGYLIGKFEILPYEDEIDLALSGGVGAEVGPVIIEWVYNVIESGDSAVPQLESKSTLWFGLCKKF